MAAKLPEMASQKFKIRAKEGKGELGGRTKRKKQPICARRKGRERRGAWK